MMFTSISFLLYLLILLVLYYGIQKSLVQRWILVIMSFFFCWSIHPLSLVPLLYVTCCSYLVGRILISSRHSRLVLTIGIVLLLLPLFFIKHSFNTITFFGCIGVSFYILIAIGYVVDVFYGRIQAEKRILDFTLFIGFFPQLVSGPISRAEVMLPQFRQVHPLRYVNISRGAWQMTWGYFMKLVLADRAALLVDNLLGNTGQYGGMSVILGVFFYSVQLYCDFAGYSLMAIGCGRLFGYELPINFRRPYFATSIADFWHRWHITLSTWLRDYVYIPCGGSRRTMWRTCMNLMITFLVSGLWHGFSLMFILWGVYHGLLMALYRLLKNSFDSCWRVSRLQGTVVLRIIQVTITYLLVSLGWLLFYSQNWSVFTRLCHALFTNGNVILPSSVLGYFSFGFVVLAIKEFYEEFVNYKLSFRGTRNFFVRSLFFAILVVIILAFGVLDGGQFIYGSF